MFLSLRDILQHQGETIKDILLIKKFKLINVYLMKLFCNVQGAFTAASPSNKTRVYSFHFKHRKCEKCSRERSL